MARSSRKPAALVGIVAIPAAVACNGILGISDYEKGDCTGGCVDGSTTFDVFQPDASKQDSSTPPVPDAGKGTQPVRWAKFKMPNYPDGGPTDNLHSYDTATAGVVIDKISDLTWRQTSAQAMPYPDAEAYCSGLQGGWRLPSRIELVTLLDLERPAANPKINAAFNAFAVEYWTSSEVRPLPTDPESRLHWTVDFKNGGLAKTAVNGTGLAAVRCIKDRTE